MKFDNLPDVPNVFLHYTTRRAKCMTIERFLNLEFRFHDICVENENDENSHFTITITGFSQSFDLLRT